MSSKRSGLSSVVLVLFVIISFLFIPIVQAATGDIQGRIHDAQGRPVKNVTVTITGTDVKAVSDEKGEFTIHAPAGSLKVRLFFEAPGFYPVTLAYELTEQGAPVDIALTARLSLTEDVLVIAPRLDIPVNENPAATSIVGPDTLDNMPRAVAADEALLAVPGVKVDNQADGERVHVSIRGQGILSERGIRGIQVLLDSIPLNDPSGFAPDLFDVNWAAVQDVNVLRGPVAFLYGGGSAGGVVSIRTHEASDATHGELWTSGGSNGFYKVHGEISGKAAGMAYVLSASRAAGDGYRQHTAFWGDNVYGKLSFNPTRSVHLNVIGMGTGFFNQNAEGLNWAQVLQDPRMPNPDALTYNEYQKTVRGTGGVIGQWSVSERQRISFTFYSRCTQYDEPVPSSIDHRAITSPGGSVQYDFEGNSGWVKHHFSTGMDLDGQFIDEYRHPNLGNAMEGPELLSNQSITQKRFAGFITERLGLGPKWTVLASIRADRFGNKLVDHIGPLSGERNFDRATGRVGITWNPSHEVGFYASWGQGFLPPATEELVANPLAYGGFNNSLVSATSQGTEIGVRGGVRSRLYYDAAVFRLDTKNDFERYRCQAVDNPPGCNGARPLETFYHNAGESRRYGIETSLKWLPVNRVTLSGAYTYSHFVYTKYTSFIYTGDLTGDWLPNSPRHQVYADADLQLPRNFSVGVGTEAYSRAYVDPTNTPFIDGYGLLNARVSKRWQVGRAFATFFVNGRNLTAKQYIAFTEPDPDGNSYQPGPEREVFAGLQLRF